MYPQDIPKIAPISRGNQQVWALETTDQAKDLETLLARATRWHLMGYPKNSIGWWLCYVCLWFMWGYFTYIYIYVLVVFRYVIWFCNWGFIWGCNMVFVPSWEDDPSWLVFGWNHQPDKFSQLSYCWWWLNWLNNYRMNVAKRCLTMPFAKIMRLKIECHGVKHL